MDNVEKHPLTRTAEGVAPAGWFHKEKENRSKPATSKKVWAQMRAGRGWIRVADASRSGAMFGLCLTRERGQVNRLLPLLALEKQGMAATSEPSTRSSEVGGQGILHQLGHQGTVAAPLVGTGAEQNHIPSSEQSRDNMPYP